MMSGPGAKSGVFDQSKSPNEHEAELPPKNEPQYLNDE